MKKEESRRRPDYRLSVLCKQTEHKGKIGAAWANEDGTISIKLDPFVVLREQDELLITMFPTDKEWNNKYFNAKKHTKTEIQWDDSDFEQPVPF